ncbi:MAG: sterol desaturase family protein [Bdellovibrionales bacterium]|nr:sterol desaturase family protein [Bdellovibrionales bacterium]
MQFLDLASAPDVAITFLGFWSLMILSASKIKMASSLRNRWDWIIDSFGLLAQGLLVPLFASMALQPVIKMLAPNTIGALNWGSWACFFLPLTLVDYLYYWNHRILHRPKLWPIHRLHHSARSMDILITSRNSLFTPLFIVYIWVHPVFLVALENWHAYLLGVAASSVLDLWRHSALSTPDFLKNLNWLIVLPEDHSFHHSSESEGFNYGANLSLWDRIHSTYKPRQFHPKEIGEQLQSEELKHLFFSPWKPRPPMPSTPRATEPS